jgi:hypothetical protein
MGKLQQTELKQKNKKPCKSNDYRVFGGELGFPY